MLNTSRREYRNLNNILTGCPTHGSQERQHSDSKPKAFNQIKEKATLRNRRIFPDRYRWKVWRLRQWYGDDGRRWDAPSLLSHVRLLPRAALHDISGRNIPTLTLLSCQTNTWSFQFMTSSSMFSGHSNPPLNLSHHSIPGQFSWVFCWCRVISPNHNAIRYINLRLRVQPDTNHYLANPARIQMM